MFDIKNITGGPKIVNSRPSIVLQAGEEREDVFLSTAEARQAEATGWFELDGEPDDDGVEQLNSLAAVGTAVDEVRRAADEHIQGLIEQHNADLEAEKQRAEKALSDLTTAQARIDELEKAKANPAPWIIAAAVGQLDAKDDDHWTKAGDPKVEAVEALLGTNLLRADIDAAAPDAKRPTE